MNKTIEILNAMDFQHHLFVGTEIENIKFINDKIEITINTFFTSHEIFSYFGKSLPYKIKLSENSPSKLQINYLDFDFGKGIENLINFPESLDELKISTTYLKNLNGDLKEVKDLYLIHCAIESFDGIPCCNKLILERCTFKNILPLKEKVKNFMIVDEFGVYVANSYCDFEKQYELVKNKKYWQERLKDMTKWANPHN